MEVIVAQLYKNADEKYKRFSVPLIPGVEEDSVIGVRIPVLRKMAKDLWKSNPQMCADFMKEIPHKYFEEIQLHGFMIEAIKDYDECVAALDKWLPMVNNWSLCDGKNPKVLRKNPVEFRKKIREWIASGEPYKIRFGIGMLMANFLDEQFDNTVLEEVAAVRSSEYYVNMMIAWFFATALAKQWDAAVIFIEERKLDQWSHNKAIQKSRESFRVSEEHKEYLQSLKWN